MPHAMLHDPAESALNIRRRRRWSIDATIESAGGGLPVSPVAVAKCNNYGSELLPALTSLFDKLGGLGGLVSGKTVAVKVNLVSSSWTLLGGYPIELTHWTHSSVIGATVHLFGLAGSRRIKVLECCGETTDPIAKSIADAGWDPNVILNADANVELENTNGPGKDGYSTIWCTGCDVMVPIAKMKEHRWFGVTLSIKNCYGMTPLNIYGPEAGIDEPSNEATGNGVTVFHEGAHPSCRD
jgi:uncharacterized protein (DUF362 family)